MTIKYEGILHNHSLVGSYPERELADIPGVWMYSARVLASTSSNDLVQLDPQLKGEYRAVAEHYERVGIEHSTNIIWNSSLEIAKDYPQYKWNPFIFSELHHQVIPNGRWLEIATAMNNKNRFARLCQQKGWQMPNTHCYDSKSLLNGHIEIDFPFYFKIACSASGAGVIKCKSMVDLKSILDKLDNTQDFQLQSPVEEATFLNVQYDVQDGRATRTIYTEQVLDGFSHAGNKYPSNCGSDPWQLCDPIAEHIADSGMNGPFAFDVAASNGKFYLIECNPRFNGCTYYSNVTRVLGITHWIARNLSVKANSLSAINLQDLEWSKDKGYGIIIISWGTILRNKLGILCCGNSDQQCQDLIEQFKALNCKE